MTQAAPPAAKPAPGSAPLGAGQPLALPEGPLRLVADVGGTNTRVALSAGGGILSETLRRYPNAEEPSLEAVLSRFRAETGRPALSGGSVAVAGPVRDNAGRLTNRDWAFAGDTLGAAIGVPGDQVQILNDLQAQGHALDHLAPGSTREVVPGCAVSGGTRLVIGVGTGFNATTVLELPGGQRTALASESGHFTLPVRSAEDMALARWLERDGRFPSVEEALSGRGMGHVDACLAETGLSAEIAPRDSAAVLAALAAGEPRARRSVEMFVRLLGAVAGDLAMIQLPFGGVFLSGGMAQALAPVMAEMGIARAMRDKGRMTEVIAEIPVAVIQDDFAALTGCAQAAERHAALLRRG